MSVPAAIVYLGDMMLIHMFQAGPELEAIFAGFTERTLTGASKHLVVLRDPDKVEIELSFALQEVQPQ
jgi:hypothetical protein